jgi:hypothetical protein
LRWAFPNTLLLVTGVDRLYQAQRVPDLPSNSPIMRGAQMTEPGLKGLIRPTGVQFACVEELICLLILNKSELEHDNKIMRN